MLELKADPLVTQADGLTAFELAQSMGTVGLPIVELLQSYYNDQPVQTRGLSSQLSKSFFPSTQPLLKGQSPKIQGGTDFQALYESERRRRMR